MFNWNGYYTCVCGKQFTKANSFNGHKSQCKIHLGDSKYIKRIESNKSKLIEATQIFVNNHKPQYIENICPRCNKIFKIKTNGYNKKYCSRSCANKHDNCTFKENNKSIFKGGWYNKIHFDSSWELAYYLYQKDQSIRITRNKKSFKYTYKDEIHNYFPDFYLPDLDLYVEIKGRETDIDLIKYKAVSNLLVINENKIKPYLDYCINKYGKNYWQLLYEK